MRLINKILIALALLMISCFNGFCEKLKIDTDKDGLPDEWELVNNLDPNDPKDASFDHCFSGWTNLELYERGETPYCYPGGITLVGYKEFGITNSCHLWSNYEQIDYMDKVADEERFRIAAEYRWPDGKALIPVGIVNYLKPIYKVALDANHSDSELPKHSLVALRLLHKIDPDKYPVVSLFGGDNRKLNSVIYHSLSDVFLPDSEITMLIDKFYGLSLKDQSNVIFIFPYNNNQLIQDFFRTSRFSEFMLKTREKKKWNWDDEMQSVEKYPGKMNDAAKAKLEYRMRRYKVKPARPGDRAIVESGV